MAESFEDIFSWDSRVLKTIVALILKPGFLTKEYFLGRRASYIPPLRLYITSSLLFFLYLSFQNVINTEINSDITNDASSEEKTLIVDEVLADSNKSTKTEVQAADESSSEIAAAIEEINISWLTEEENLRLQSSLQTRADKALLVLQEDPGQIANSFLDIAPAIMFLLLPLFALLLKIVYITSGRFYAEHLVLAVHNHSALFLIILLSALLEWLATITELYLGSTIVLAWLPLYMFLSLKKVFSETLPITLFKFTLLGLNYLILFSFAFAFSWIAGIMTL